MTTFQPDELVDIVIRGARVDYHFDPADGDTALTITIPGCDEQLDIPMVDDEGGLLRQVIVTRVDIISVTPSPVMRALAATTIPAGPGTGPGLTLHAAVMGAVHDHGLPLPVGTGSSDELGRWIRLRTVDDARTWARALGLRRDTGIWGSEQIMLTVATGDLSDGYRLVPNLLDDDLDLSTLGQDYIKDPAERIKAIAAEFPELVVRVDGGEQL